MPLPNDAALENPGAYLTAKPSEIAVLAALGIQPLGTANGFHIYDWQAVNRGCMVQKAGSQECWVHKARATYTTTDVVEAAILWRRGVTLLGIETVPGNGTQPPAFIFDDTGGRAQREARQVPRDHSAGRRAGELLLTLRQLRTRGRR